jgi:hypothetical protein
MFAFAPQNHAHGTLAPQVGITASTKRRSSSSLIHLSAPGLVLHIATRRTHRGHPARERFRGRRGARRQGPTPDTAESYSATPHPRRIRLRSMAASSRRKHGRHGDCCGNSP